MAEQFPYEIYRKLEGVDFRLIDELTFLINLQAQRTGSRYCIPGRKYLARKLGVGFPGETEKFLALAPPSWLT